MKRRMFLTGVLSLIVLFAQIYAFAQSVRGRIEGTVKDSQGQVVPNVALTVTNSGTGQSLEIVSSEEGGFVIPELQPGTYKIEAAITGFKKVAVEGIIVQVATVSNVNILLEVGAVSEQVTITAADAQEVVNTSNPEVGDVVDRQRILDLPLDGRNPLELTALQAGVQTKTNADGEIASFSINGNRTVANNVTVDGVNASDNFLKTPANITLPVIPVSVESIGEFRVTTTLASAEFGRGTSQINAITASGTNEFRGSIFEFHRNTVFNANTFFNNSTILENGENVAREPLIRNQFGGRFGGPVIFPKLYNGRDRTFFFFSYEGKRESRGLSRNRTVYTAQARQGIFRYLNGLPNTPANVAANPSLIRTINVLGINSQRTTIDPTMREYLAGTPLPNNFQLGDGLNTGGFRFNSKIISPTDQFATRIDHRINNRNSLETTFSYGKIVFLGDYINTGEPFFPNSPYRTRTTLGRGLSTTLRSTITPTIINELRFGAQISRLDFGNTADFSRGYVFDIATVTEPQNNFAGSGRNLRVLQFTDNLTFVRGEHTFKTGVEIRLPWVRRYSYADTIPTVDFSTGINDPEFSRTTNFPGSNTTDFELARTLANTLTGAVGSVTQLFNVTSRDSGFVRGAPEVRTYSNWETDMYFQDTWRFRPNLTLSLGVRYEYSNTPKELDGLALLPIGGSAALYGISGAGNLFQPGNTPGRPPVLDYAADPLYRSDKNNVAPVLGIAYDPFKDGKTSIRAGYRLSYVRGSFNLIDGTLDDNEGLILTTQRNIDNFLSNGIAQAPLPTVTIPAPQSIQTASTVDIRAFDENLRSPQVHEWTVGIQREIFKKTSLEIRYVGNRGRDLYRGYTINEINVFARDNTSAQTFLEAFNIAQNNLNVFRAARPTSTPSFAYNASIPGSRQNPLMDVLFTGQTSNYTLSNFVIRLDENRAGDFADYLMRVRTLNGIRGGSFLNAVNAGRLPRNFFRANPDVRGAQLFANGSTSAYDALQIEMARRLSGGLRLQGNYTFSKGLSDFIGSTGDTNSFLTLRDRGREYAQFNNTHQLSANVIYQLPFGRNKSFFRNSKGWVNRLVEGWQVSSIVRYTSGDPLSILSGRGTVNADLYSGSNTVDVVGGLSRDQIQAITGVRTASSGVFYIDPNLAPGSSSDSSKVIFLNPQAGTVGSLGLSTIYGPRYFNADFSTIKRTRFTETINLEFRAEIFNVFNTVNFANPETDINSANFGRIDSTFGKPRLMQFALRLNF